MHLNDTCQQYFRKNDNKRMTHTISQPPYLNPKTVSNPGQSAHTEKDIHTKE